MISDFLWWFDDLAWWKKGLFIFKTIGLIIVIAAWLFYVPTVQSLGGNKFEIHHINKIMSRHDYYLMGEEHCQSLGLEITNYEAKNPYDRVNTRRHSAISTFFSCR